MKAHPYRRSSRRPAFSLMEMLLALGLIVIAFGLGTELCSSMLNLWAQTAKLNDRTNRIDSAALRMRNDVWGSSDIRVGDPQTAVVTLGDNTISTWHIEADGKLQRTDALAQNQNWDVDAKGWHFQREGPSLVVIDDKAVSAVPMQAVSQVLLAAKVKP
ncbi:MAG: hypothetical protein M3O30_06395 [Planctomycetota bacterium]|nr:hypothetical protein [Planctomycetota bacterium]